MHAQPVATVTLVHGARRSFDNAYRAISPEAPITEWPFRAYSGYWAVAPAAYWF
jgi:hypothetical protein